jgi:hypothetical protein
MSNILKGRDSFDATAGNVLVPFFNRNVTPYATEAGGPQFDLVPVEKQKDIMLNVARMHAQQEYDRIVELVRVLEGQARQIKRRLEITDAVHGAEYQFQTYHGQVYWLVYEREKQKTILSKTGPDGWSSGPPESYEYIAAVKWLGDHTWQEVTDV